MKKENSKKTIIFSILLTIDFVIGIIGYYKMNFNSSLLFVEWIRKIFSIPYGKEFSVGIFDRGERLFWYVWILQWRFWLQLLSMSYRIINQR